MTPDAPARLAAWAGSLGRSWAGLARWPLLLAFVVWNVAMLAHTAEYVASGLQRHDWYLFSIVNPADAYSNGWYKWSVATAILFKVAILPLGFGLWIALHFVALATLPRKVAVIALVTFPFWADVTAGNVMTFVLVLAWHALEGKRWAVVGFCVAAALIPRPVMLPVLALLLWRRMDARVAFGWGAVVVVATALGTGQLDDWLRNLIATPAGEIAAPWNFGPSRILGYAWVPVGLAIAAVAFRRGRLGIAAIAISPYVIHYYYLMALLELRGQLRNTQERLPAIAATAGAGSYVAGAGAHPSSDLEGVAAV